MKAIAINTMSVNLAAEERGLSAEEYVSRITTISYGRKVCAHLIAEGVNGKSIFDIVSVRTLRAGSHRQ